MKYWLIKSEPGDFSIDDLEAVTQEPWTGVRNYQARNFMRDDMEVGDLALFYHSNAKPSGVVGIAKVASKPYPDATQFDKKDSHYDAKSKKEDPRWVLVDFSFVEKFPHIISLAELKQEPALEGMMVCRKGLRLSITPVEKKHFQKVCKMAK